MFSSFLPTRVIGGEEALLKNGERLKRFGDKCLIVTGKTSARLSGALSDLEKVLRENGIRWKLFDGIEQNPLVETCYRAAEMAADVDFVVGIGGGSPLDAAKVIALLARNRLNVEELYSLQWPERPLPIVCIGTTAGTGSEITHVSVLTRDGRKKSLTADSLAPALSFCDPRYTASCSWFTTMSCGLDALCHATEGFFAERSTVLTDSIAERAIPMLLEALKESADYSGRPADNIPFSLRDSLYTGAILAGYVLNDTGTGFPHAMGYILTENFGIPHGLACAAFLPAYLERADKAMPEKFSRLFTQKDIAWIDSAVNGLLSEKDIRMTAEFIEQQTSRFENNKNFRNSPGTPDAAFGKSLLENMFLK